MTNDHGQKPSHTLTRRELLKLAGVGAGGLLLRPELAYASGEVDAENAAAMLYDATKCVGCRACEVACREWNDLPPEAEFPSDTTAHTWTLIKQYQGESSESFRKYQCMHCLDPACVSVCTVGALSKTEDGPVVYDTSKCIGCRYCQYACPFGVPKFEWENPLGLIGKCTFCADRLTDGLIPACAEACPAGALTFGTREQVLKEAKKRIEQNPERYIDHVYGEMEGGGTSVLFLSDIPFEELGLPTLGSAPVTHASVMVANATPVTFATAAAVFSGIYWLTKRRNEGLKEKEN
ncbi:MAG: hydrogenase 2 operon protein HybA [Chloroflexota bacterium]|nr:hydrogenase 2 operon protein HybA [Chloroflexota bacterium]